MQNPTIEIGTFLEGNFREDVEFKGINQAELNGASTHNFKIGGKVSGTVQGKVIVAEKKLTT